MSTSLLLPMCVWHCCCCLCVYVGLDPTQVLLAATSDLALIPHHLRCNCPYTDCQVGGKSVGKSGG